MGTKEYGKMLKRLQILEDGRAPAKEAKDWKIEGRKRRITRKEYRRQSNEFKMEGLMVQKRVMDLCERERDNAGKMSCLRKKVM